MFRDKWTMLETRIDYVWSVIAKVFILMKVLFMLNSDDATWCDQHWSCSWSWLGSVTHLYLSPCGHPGWCRGGSDGVTTLNTCLMMSSNPWSTRHFNALKPMGKVNKFLSLLTEDWEKMLKPGPGVLSVPRWVVSVVVVQPDPAQWRSLSNPARAASAGQQCGPMGWLVWPLISSAPSSPPSLGAQSRPSHSVANTSRQ